MKMLCPALLILVFHLLKRLLKIPSPKRTKNRMDRAAATIKNRRTAYTCIRFFLISLHHCLQYGFSASLECFGIKGILFSGVSMFTIVIATSNWRLPLPSPYVGQYPLPLFSSAITRTFSFQLYLFTPNYKGREV